MKLPDFTAADIRRIRMIAACYRNRTGRPLVDDTGDIPLALWQSPLIIVAHDTAPDPIFFFGNVRALQLFEMNFADFTRLPSRLSAEAPLQEDRARVLETVSRAGFIENYAGVRISSTGKRFRIAQATVWNLVDDDDTVHGQAAAFAEWHPLA